MTMAGDCQESLDRIDACSELRPKRVSTLNRHVNFVDAK